jgi:hypothetical protein
VPPWPRGWRRPDRGLLNSRDAEALEAARKQFAEQTGSGVEAVAFDVTDDDWSAPFASTPTWETCWRPSPIVRW